MLSAYDALKSKDTQIIIPSGSKSIDGMLGGGFHVGSVYEIAGMAGLGKTQLCMQLCANAFIASNNGGKGEALFIDCEGSFTPTRLQQMCIGTAELISTNAGTPKVQFDEIMSKISIQRVYNLAELESAICSLDKVLQRSPEIRVVLVDSIAFFFRSFGGDFTIRGQKLSLLSQTMRSVAQMYKVVIVSYSRNNSRLSPIK